MYVITIQYRRLFSRDYCAKKAWSPCNFYKHNIITLSALRLLGHLKLHFLVRSYNHQNIFFCRENSCTQWQTQEIHYPLMKAILLIFTLFVKVIILRQTVSSSWSDPFTQSLCLTIITKFIPSWLIKWILSFTQFFPELDICVKGRGCNTSHTQSNFFSNDHLPQHWWL